MLLVVSPFPPTIAECGLSCMYSFAHQPTRQIGRFVLLVVFVLSPRTLPDAMRRGDNNDAIVTSMLARRSSSVANRLQPQSVVDARGGSVLSARRCPMA